MTDSRELYNQYRRLNALREERGWLSDPEPGDRVVYRGHEYTVAAAQEDTLGLVDDLAGIPFDPSSIVYAHKWDDDPDCFMKPGMEQLLEIIEKQTSVFPVMTPGVKDTRTVWQVSHPNSPPIVSRTLEQGLLELAVRVLDADR